MAKFLIPVAVLMLAAVHFTLFCNASPVVVIVDDDDGAADDEPVVIEAPVATVDFRSMLQRRADSGMSKMDRFRNFVNQRMLRIGGPPRSGPFVGTSM